jgi:Uma2 family endonuclease
MATAMPSKPATPREPHRLTLSTYNRMGELGLLGPRDRVELLDGLLVKKMTKGPRHVTATTKSYKLLIRLLPPGWTVRQEAPIELPGGPEGDSAPEPDLVIAAGTDDDYRERHPGPGDIALVIELSDSTLAEDRKARRRYGWAGIPVVWIVDLNRERVEIHTRPSGPREEPGYASREDRSIGSPLACPLAEGTMLGPIAVEDLLA